MPWSDRILVAYVLITGLTTIFFVPIGLYFISLISNYNATDSVSEPTDNTKN